MAYNLGTTKSATGFTILAANTGGQFGATNTAAGGDLGTQAKPSTLFSTPLSSAAAPATTATLNFGFGGATATATTTTTTTTGLAFGAPTSAPQFSLGAALSTAPASSTGFGFGASLTTTTAPSTSFSLGSTTLSFASPATTSAAPLGFTALGMTATTSSAPSFSFGGLTTTTTAIASALPAAGTLSFAQLEDAINKWTVDLEEQGKVFANQAKHLNAWDRLLMTNGEKILSVSNGVERIKQQQQQLDQELDFVLAQQKELEECIIPLEKEYKDVPVSDVDRDQTYKLAENIDAQLKQMSEDLKEIIEHLNESNKVQELSDPVAQIGRILNAHMNSLQWIDRSTSQISSHLDEIAKMHDLNRRNHENIHGA
ncbi:hypothetical protein ILUMI_06908 [Ignelater luminosus]|uniref:Nucleoporin NSP1-like C-terminal domain-containing protein n=1 Tax=Ignelater luminosus TaxID=2038154 RepID=A0A8K0D926_IGNLU|nr:hypothetical protein ILUMI_06908 [Ignelater luminosus]